MFAVAYEWIKTNLKNDDGQTMAEYGIILAVVAVLCITAFAALQGGITGTLNSIVAKL
jgi:pilus assembly protein Flp/PilA